MQQLCTNHPSQVRRTWATAMVRAQQDSPSAQHTGFLVERVGENPLNVERLWDKMYQGTIYTGRRGLVIHAIGAVDLALWDIAGKALGCPVYELRCDWRGKYWAMA